MVIVHELKFFNVIVILKAFDFSTNQYLNSKSKPFNMNNT